MTIRYINPRVVGCCMFGLLTACASTPDTDDGTVSGEQFNSSSMDVMFATEYPVESELDAMARADLALQEGEVEKALFFYVRALQFQPDNVDLLVHIGEIQSQRDNLAMAKRAFLMAQQHDPNHSGSLEGLGLIYMVEEMHDQAIVNLESAIANNDERWRAHNALGVYADKAGNYSTAQEHFDAALSINPLAAHVLNNRGYSKFLAGNIQGATDDLYEAAHDRGFVQAWSNLGRIYATTGSYGDAIKTYKHVMSEARALNSTGYAAIENEDFMQAEHFLTEAIRLSPRYFPAAEENLATLRDLQ